MKWKDLSIKERKQVYDHVKSTNPDSTYFDIKQQFDSVPAYEDGGKKLPDNIKLPPEYTPGTPEYFKRQKDISGRADVIQPEAYITPAGYVKDAVNFVEDLTKGDYSGAVIDALLNVIPWGVGKTLKKVKGRVSKANGLTQELNSYAPSSKTATKGKRIKPLTEAEIDEQFGYVMKKHNNVQSHEKELGEIIDDLLNPQNGGMDIINRVDKDYGTNYKQAASRIAYQDMSNRGKYVKHQTIEDPNGNPIYGRTTGKTEEPTIDDLTVYLNPDYYMQGTANHELSHVADAITNKLHDKYTTNSYMDYLLDEGNIMDYGTLKRSFINVNPSTYRYITTPAENKAHMIQLKRGLKKEGLINNWTDKVTQEKIEKYLSYENKSANRVNPVLRDMYDIRRDKSSFIQRMNNLTPIEYAAPLGLSGFMGYELNKE